MVARRKTARGSLRLVNPNPNQPWLGSRGQSIVLVVDDEDSIRQFLRSALESEGFGVLTAGDGEEALSLCAHTLPDLILLDLMMPRLDGLGFLHEFRRRFGSDADRPVYIMSAVRTATEHARAAGVAGVFVKPFDLNDLLDTVQRELHQPGGGSDGNRHYMHA